VRNSAAGENQDRRAGRRDCILSCPIIKKQTKGGRRGSSEPGKNTELKNVRRKRFHRGCAGQKKEAAKEDQEGLGGRGEYTKNLQSRRGGGRGGHGPHPEARTGERETEKLRKKIKGRFRSGGTVKRKKKEEGSLLT